MQQSTTVVLGWEMAMRIFPLVVDSATGLFTSYGAGRWFGFKGGTLTTSADKHECGDSLSGRNKRYKAGRTSFEMTADFYEKWDVDVHADFVPPVPPATEASGGFELKNGGIVGVAVYTQGFDEVAGVWFPPFWAPNFTIFNVKYAFDEEGKVNGNWDGAADNAWYRPGEVIPVDQRPPG